MQRDEPFRILIVGDFGGGDRADGLADRPIRQVDRDDFEQLFEALGVRATIAPVAEAGSQELVFPEFDTLHPDWLYEHVAGFERLRRLRRQLLRPETFEQAAAEIRGARPAAEPASAEGGADGPAPAAGGGLLEAALEATDQQESGRLQSGGELVDAILRDLVIPNVTPAADPRRDELVAAVDEATSDLMRRVLRELRGLEARWLGLRLLVQRLETDARLSLHVLDVSDAELDAECSAAASAEDSGLWRRLVDEAVGTPGGLCWAALALADPVGSDPGSCARLALLADVAAAAGAVCVAGADPSWLGEPGAPSPAEQIPAARPAGLCLVGPRILLRMPYGARGGEVERFRFEELPPADGGASCCWSSGAFAALTALGVWFGQTGWSLDPRARFELDRLPVWIEEGDSGPEMLPCAERLLSDRDVEPLAESGLSLLRSVRGQDVVRVGPLRGVAGQPLSWPEGRGR